MKRSFVKNIMEMHAMHINKKSTFEMIKKANLISGLNDKSFYCKIILKGKKPVKAKFYFRLLSVALCINKVCMMAKIFLDYFSISNAYIS